MDGYHIPVLLEQSVSALILNPDGIYADATFGGGGHSAEILSRLSKKGRLTAFDRDSDAIDNIYSQNNPKREILEEAIESGRMTLVRSDFRFIHNHLLAQGYSSGIDGIMADLGVSSHQFDTPERGFSFRYDAPLDMRMNTESGLTAADIVNTYTEEDLARILRLYGEVDQSARIASLICRARNAKKIETTSGLDGAIAPALPKFAEHKFLAKVYQALRIEVNHEMQSLEKFLYGAQKSLKKGGRLVVITYHSLEDRMVKNFIKTGNVEGETRSDIYGNTSAGMRAVNRKPETPQESEIAMNTRARSAKMRIAEKI